LIVGEQEETDDLVAVRNTKTKEQIVLSQEELLVKLQEEIQTKKL
jgi:threonyl-tRNA synthetase